MRYILTLTLTLAFISFSSLAETKTSEIFQKMCESAQNPKDVTKWCHLAEKQRRGEEIAKKLSKATAPKERK